MYIIIHIELFVLLTCRTYLLRSLYTENYAYVSTQNCLGKVYIEKKEVLKTLLKNIFIIIKMN